MQLDWFVALKHRALLLGIVTALAGCRGTTRCPDGERFDDNGECVPVSTCPGGRDPVTGVCSNTIDAGPSIDANLPDGCTITRYYLDEDGDGAGSDTVLDSCDSTPPEGYAGMSGDCDDTDSSTHPGAEEACNGRDDDCDDSLDEALSPQATFYLDSDADGFGDDGATLQACAAPSGYVDVGGDCAPADNAAYPGAPEQCDGSDDDCDTGVDEGAMRLVGSERSFASGESFMDIESEGSTYWIALVSDGAPTLVHLDAAGQQVGLPLSWSATSSVWTVGLSMADTAIGSRAVLAWRDGSSVFAAVVDTSAPAAATPLMLGTAGGDQSLVSVKAIDGSVLVAWQSSRNLRARQVDPVGNRTQGVLLDEEVSTMGGMFFQGPTLAASETSGEAWVAFPALRAGDTGEAAYIARISTGASPSWSGVLARSMPYPDLILAVLGPPWAMKLPVLIGGGSGACLQELTTGSSPGFEGSCDPAPGNLTSGVRRRGGVLSALLTHSGNRIALADLSDAPGTEGSPFLNLDSTPAVNGNLAYTDSGTAGMAIYAVGASAPYDLIAQPIGCE